MNRRKFLQTSALAVAGASLSSCSHPHGTAHGVHWPIGCFNRPWNEKKDWGLDAALDGIKAAGYKYIGLLRRQKDEPLAGSDATQDYLEGLKKRIAARGLKTNMAALRTNNKLSFEDQVKDMRKQLDNARFLGASFGLTFGVNSTDEYENYYKLMRDAAAYAHDRGVHIVLKPHGGASGAAEEIVRCMDKVNHPNFKVWFDAGNIIFYTGKDPVEQLRPVVKDVTGLCAKDCNGQKGSVVLEFGTGKVDFRAVFTEMKNAGFHGPVMVECVAPSDSPEMATANARKNREYLQNLFKTL